MIAYDVKSNPPPHIVLWDSGGNRWEPVGVETSLPGNDTLLWSARAWIKVTSWVRIWLGVTSWNWIEMQRFAPFTDEPREPK